MTGTKVPRQPGRPHGRAYLRFTIPAGNRRAASRTARSVAGRRSARSHRSAHHRKLVLVIEHGRLAVALVARARPERLAGLV
jgi:hypothetical protein